MSHPDLVYPPPAYGGDDGLENATVYFETLDRVGRGTVMDDEERADFFLRHDTFWLPQDGD